MAKRTERSELSGDPQWYKDAIFYELRVGAFYDSDGDGIGDFRGLAERLDYLQELGVTTLWLLPFYPSPFRDDGYDIAEFTDVHPDYGTLDDFRHFLREAHSRDLRVITELVINHTSDQHPWFQRARRAPAGSRWRDYYVWSDSPERYSEARIIFRDFEPSNWSWDPIAKAYYWHRFYSHQPDLNFDHPEVRRAFFKIMEFWLDMGVDGMRLDAVPYLFEREGTNCENLPQTHEYLAELRRHVDRRYRDRMFLAEANQWPEDAVAYFGSGDECHMAFHFPIMPRLFMALNMEDRYPIIDIIQQTPAIPEACQWALFLRNHDELTLEMVTDEERDYMYRVYAHDARARINLGIRRRLAPLLGNDRRRIELMNALLFALPGTPVIYYGDEIGMGDNFYLGDRDGVRTPMQWSGDRNAGFSRANPQRLYLPVIIDPEYHYESHNVEAQHDNRHSLLQWTRRLIALRKRYHAFGRGKLDFLHPANRRVLAFARTYEDERILVVANLSRFVEYVELDLSSWRGMVPVELFGRNSFPMITDAPYLLTLGPHSFYWFSLEKPQAETEAALAQRDLPLAKLEIRGSLETFLRGEERTSLERALQQALPTYRWFGGKALNIRGAEIIDTIEVPFGASRAYLLIVEVTYRSGSMETYVIPLAFANDRRAGEIASYARNAIVAEVSLSGREGESHGVLYDAFEEPGFSRALLALIERRRRVRGTRGELAGVTTRAFRDLNERSASGNGAGGPTPAAASPGGAKSVAVTANAPAGEGDPAATNGANGATPTTEGEANGAGNPDRDGSNGAPSSEPSVTLLRAEQSNTSVALGDRFILKMNRRLPVGGSPEVEMGRYLTDRLRFDHIAPLAGHLEYRIPRTDPQVIGVLHGLIENEGDAWHYSLDQLGQFLEHVLARRPAEIALPDPKDGPLALIEREPPSIAVEMIGAYLETARLLGQRTAELHLALGAPSDDPDFAPEPFTTLYQRSLYQSMRNLASNSLRLLREPGKGFPPELREEAAALLTAESAIFTAFQWITGRRIESVRTRVHGDFHLGQMLHTGKDFVIIDFEGEPARSPTERRLKRSPLIDVAGMLRSFDYSAHAGLLTAADRGVARKEDIAVLAPWAGLWSSWSSSAFLRSYLHRIEGTDLAPRDQPTLAGLLHTMLLEKALYELAYELNNRPGWVAIPLRGIAALLRQWSP